MQIRSVMTSYCLQLKMVKYWINDISGNIEAVFLKFGTINVHHKRNKMTPNSFATGAVLIKTENPSFCVKRRTIYPTKSLLMGVTGKTMWELCLFQVGTFVSLKRLQMEDLFFGQKETGAKRVAMATALRASFCFLCDGQLWCQVSRTLL